MSYPAGGCSGPKAPAYMYGVSGRLNGNKSLAAVTRVLRTRVRRRRQQFSMLPASETPVTNHSFRAPAARNARNGARAPRFAVQQPAPGGQSLRQSIHDSRRERASRAVQMQQTARELDAFMSAIDEVERAGPRLHRLPRERLLEIQQILGGGISGPDGAVILAPVNPAGGATLSHQRDRRAARGERERYYDPQTNSIVHRPPSNDAAPLQQQQQQQQQQQRKGLSALELSLVSKRRFTCAGHAPTTGHGSGDPDDDEDEACAICLACMDAGEQLVALPCTHRYHWPCLERWLGVSELCPLCKTHALGCEYEEERRREREARGGSSSGGASTLEEEEEEASQLIEAAAAAIGASRAASLGLPAPNPPALGGQMQRRVSAPTPPHQPRRNHAEQQPSTYLPPPPPSNPPPPNPSPPNPPPPNPPPPLRAGVHAPAGRLHMAGGSLTPPTAAHAAASASNLGMESATGRPPPASASYAASAAAFSLASAAASAAAAAVSGRGGGGTHVAAVVSPWAYTGDPRLAREPAPAGRGAPGGLHQPPSQQSAARAAALPTRPAVHPAANGSVGVAARPRPRGHEPALVVDPSRMRLGGTRPGPLRRPS